MSNNWVPFYRELAGAVLAMGEEKQGQLLAVLQSMKAQGLPTIPLEDNQPGGGKAPLQVIDPFTFLANFSRVDEARATKLCAWIKKTWNLSADIPKTFSGRVQISGSGTASWFFTSRQDGREDTDIGKLWRLARQAYDAGGVGPLDATLVQECLGIRGVRMGKLTTGLHWLSPTGFLPLTSHLLSYLKEHHKVHFDDQKLSEGNLEEYSSLMAAAHEESFDNLKLTQAAWQWHQQREAAKGKAPDHNLDSLPEFPANHILYGPPGTGKTFSAVPYAVRIIDGEAPEDREACQARFEALQRSGQIAFVTFHQSFAYEEFVEGLRPVVDNMSGTARYEVRDGVLKEMALKALGSALVPRTSGAPGFDRVWELFVEHVENNPDELIKGIQRSKYEVTVDGNRIIGINRAGKSHLSYPSRRELVEKAWYALKGVDTQKIDTTAVYNATQVGTHPSFIAALLVKMRELAEKSGTQKAGQEETVSGDTQKARSFFNGSTDYIPSFHTAPRYVLIIDEINRGNISRILGELITLLEDDKRLGRSNELRVTLPVSQEIFGLPPNLYLLGTMNTADKSLALLDTALRRRFVFEEVRPDFGAVGLPHPFRAVLETLNLRLEYALDREHCLGHAYFVGVNSAAEFNAVFRTKIIPLLQEFFYNDWETLRAVLGESGAPDGFIRILKAPPGMRGRTPWRWWFDANPAEELDCLAVLMANYGLSPAGPEQDTENSLAQAATAAVNGSAGNGAPGPAMPTGFPAP